MLKDLVKVANRLDSLGLTKEAETMKLTGEDEETYFLYPEH